MTYDPHGTKDIAIGTPVVAADGTTLGRVREAHPHYLLVGQDGEHSDLEIPVHAIIDLEAGKLRVSINREAVTSVDDVETAHRQVESDQE
jgi:hypothetical protein